MALFPDRLNPPPREALFASETDLFMTQVAADFHTTLTGQQITTESPIASLHGAQDDAGRTRWDWPMVYENGVVGAVMLSVAPEMDRNDRQKGYHVTVSSAAFIPQHREDSDSVEMQPGSYRMEIVAYGDMPMRLNQSLRSERYAALMEHLFRATEMTHDLADTLPGLIADPALDKARHDAAMVDTLEKTLDGSGSVFVLRAQELENAS